MPTSRVWRHTPGLGSRRTQPAMQCLDDGPLPVWRPRDRIHPRQSVLVDGHPIHRAQALIREDRCQCFACRVIGQHERAEGFVSMRMRAELRSRRACLIVRSACSWLAATRSTRRAAMRASMSRRPFTHRMISEMTQSSLSWLKGMAVIGRDRTVLTKESVRSSHATGLIRVMLTS